MYHPPPSLPLWGLSIVLMAYGFCIPDNPFNSVSLKLPYDSTLYSITLTNLVPEALLQAFCLETFPSWRECLTNKNKGKKYLYDGYVLMIRALAVKLSMLEDIQTESTSDAAKYAIMYRISERELLILAYEHLVELANSLVKSAKTISSNEILRKQGISKKRRKKPEIIDTEMVLWLCRRIYHINDSQDDGVSDERRAYLKELLETFYERIDWMLFDSLDKESQNQAWAQSLQDELQQSGLDISLSHVRIACEIWGTEQTEIILFPETIRELFSQLQGKEELQEALAGQVVDVVLLKDELNELDGHWDPNLMMEMKEKYMNRR